MQLGGGKRNDYKKKTWVHKDDREENTEADWLDYKKIEAVSVVYYSNLKYRIVWHSILYIAYYCIV